MNQPVPDELISAYFDGEVTPEERERIERSLESSGDLRQLLDDTSKLSALLHSFPREAVPGRLSKNVQEQINSVFLTSLPPVVRNLRSMRREWIAFGAGMMATATSLFLLVGFRPSLNHGNSPMARSTAMSPIKTSENELGKDVTITPSRPTRDDGHVAVASNLPHKDIAPAFPLLSVPVINESSTQSLSLTDNENGDVLNLLRPSNEEFLHSLKSGMPIERHILDPDNTVMVVEVTVVDINKGVEGLVLLLQKRNLSRVDNDVSLTVADGINSTDASPIASNRNSPTSDGLFALYVRGSGAELADMLSDLVKDQPELYRDMAPQFSIEVPRNGASISVNVALSDHKSTSGIPTEVAKNDEPLAESTDPLTVSVEANRVAQVFAASKSMAVENSLSANAEILKQYQTVHSRVGSGPVASIASVNEPTRTTKTNELNLPTMQDKLDKVDRSFDKVRQPIGKNSKGYAAFRFVADKQGLPADQSQTQQNFALGSQYRPLGNNGNSPDAINSRQRIDRPSSDQRDPQLMRMLIVVKPEQAAQNP